MGELLIKINKSKPGKANFQKETWIHGSVKSFALIFLEGLKAESLDNNDYGQKTENNHEQQNRFVNCW